MIQLFIIGLDSDLDLDISNLESLIIFEIFKRKIATFVHIELWLYVNDNMYVNILL